MKPDLRVECPFCHAAIGEPCIERGTGKWEVSRYISRSHDERQLPAQQALDAEYDPIVEISTDYLECNSEVAQMTAQELSSGPAA